MHHTVIKQQGCVIIIMIEHLYIDHEILSNRWIYGGGGLTPHHPRSITNQEDYLLVAYIIYIYIYICKQ